MTVDDRLFGSALSLLSDLMAEGRAFVNLQPPFSVTFEVNREVLTQHVTAAGLDREDFTRASTEIAEFVLAILQGKTNEMIEAHVSHEEDTAKKDATRSRMTSRLAEARSLVNDRLQLRYELRVNSKAPAFASLEWDVKRKLFDGTHGDLACSYATLKLTHQRDFDLGPATFFGRNLFDSVSINVTSEEVDYLVKELGRVLDKLRAAEAGDESA